MRLTWLQKRLLAALVGMPEFETWLRERALVLPARQKQSLATKLHVSIASIEAIEAELQSKFISELGALLRK